MTNWTIEKVREWKAEECARWDKVNNANDIRKMAYDAEEIIEYLLAKLDKWEQAERVYLERRYQDDGTQVVEVCDPINIYDYLIGVKAGRYARVPDQKE